VMFLDQILITGSNGFIGKRLKEKLIALNYNIIELNSKDGDITNIDIVRKLDFRNISHVFHLAAKTFVPDSWIKPHEFYKVNSYGTVNIIETCKEYNISLTFVSSYIYGEPDSLPISENAHIKPNNPYAHSKFMAEQFCEFYAKEFNLNVTVLRPFNVYGIGQDNRFLIPHIIHQAIRNASIEVKDLAPKRDYVFLDDLIQALVLTIDNKRGYSVYNIGSGYSISVKEVIDIVQKVLNINKPVITEDKVRKNEISDVFADIRKANNELNWFPRYSFVDGINEIIKYAIKY
jgi:nucleoside-diphosphate-sugar epimerase